VLFTTYSLNFKPTFDSPFVKNCKGTLVNGEGALTRLCHYLARVKMRKCSTPYGPKYGLSKRRFKWVQFDLQIFVVTGPKFTGLFFTECGRNRGHQVLVQFWISLSIPKIFAIKFWSHPKSGQILHVFGP